MRTNQKTSIRAKILEKIKTRAGKTRGNMTPMIDVVFLLLIFFIISSRFRPPEGALPMLLPTPQGGQGGRLTLVEPLVIKLDSQGQSLIVETSQRQFVYDNVTTASLVALGEEISSLFSQQRRGSSDPIELDCGENLSWEHLVKFYNLMYGMGATNITFLLDK